MAPGQEKVKKVKKSAPAKAASPVRNPETQDPLSKKRVPKKKKRVEGGNFKFCIHRVLKQVYPELGINIRAMSTMNSFINDMFERILTEAAVVVKYSRGKTLTSQVIQTAVRLVLPGEIGNHAVSEGNKALLKYSRTEEKST